MNFIQRFQNGWRLFVGSLSVMRKNKSLLLFPIATAGLTIVMAGLFLTPIALQPSGHSYSESSHWKEVSSRLFTEVPATGMDAARGRKTTLKATPQAIAYCIIFYFLSMFMATFFNVAFVHEIFDALNGQPVSVSEGLQFAGTKLKPILMWTLFAGLIGLLIRTLEQKFGIFGRWVVRFIGLAWSVAAVFVIPVLVMEEHPDNPIGVVRQSAGVIKKTWGEALAGYAGLQIGGIIGALSGLIVISASFYIGFAYRQWGLMMTGIFGWLAFVVALSYVMSVAGQIYLCMLYRYASTGTVPDGFTPEMLAMAWTPKKS
jgi:hypothetical protein